MAPRIEPTVVGLTIRHGVARVIDRGPSALDRRRRAPEPRRCGVLKRSLILPAVFLATSPAWAAESPFIGEWKLDSSKSRMPDEMKIQRQGGNKYTFDFGAGAEAIVVDGSDQPGVFGTLLSVKPEAPDTWIVERKKEGKLL